jgi:transposase InsO family protein
LQLYADGGYQLRIRRLEGTPNYGPRQQDKTKTQGTLKRFLRRAQNKFELKVKKIRSDNGSEFKNLQVEEYLEEEGIKHEFSAPYTPQQMVW